ncbi:DUF3088 family protein [Vibrio sp. DNB22_10_4]|jgi:glutathione S-transferase
MVLCEPNVEVCRIPFAKPRDVLVAALGSEHQWLPVLILEDKQTITEPEAIIDYLAEQFSGPQVHP